MRVKSIEAVGIVLAMIGSKDFDNDVDRMRIRVRSGRRAVYPRYGKRFPAVDLCELTSKASATSGRGYRENIAGVGGVCNDSL